MESQRWMRKVDEMMGQLNADVTVPGLLWPLAIEGVKARRAAVADPLANFVGLAQFTEDTVDAGIERVLAAYAREGVPFSWVVGPTSRPATLRAHLTAHGFQEAEALRHAGMVREPLDDIEDPLPEVTFTVMSPADSPALYAWAARAFGPPMTPDLASLGFRVMAAWAPHETTVYLASLPETPDPVGFGIAYFDPDGEAVWLGGAAVAPEYRGRGVYAALVARRLRDARARGYRAAMIHAMKATSAPLSAKRGFTTVCDIDTYLAPPART
ncbi:MAG: GNAT family N-acetyltransferase [Firmicutes bacterium]|nr:GNAT family N-acetyltransferase [Bacillota bacterium]